MTIDLINELANEKTRLYCELSKPGHDKAQTMRRIAEIENELDEAWEQRRATRCFNYDDIDMHSNVQEIHKGYLAWDRHTWGKRGA